MKGCERVCRWYRMTFSCDERDYPNRKQAAVYGHDSDAPISPPAMVTGNARANNAGTVNLRIST